MGIMVQARRPAAVPTSPGSGSAGEQDTHGRRRLGARRAHIAPGSCFDPELASVGFLAKPRFPGEQTPAQYLERAVGYKVEGKYEDALGELQALLAISPALRKPITSLAWFLALPGTSTDLWPRWGRRLTFRRRIRCYATTWRSPTPCWACTTKPRSSSRMMLEARPARPRSPCTTKPNFQYRSRPLTYSIPRWRVPLFAMLFGLLARAGCAPNAQSPSPGAKAGAL